MILQSHSDLLWISTFVFDAPAGFEGFSLLWGKYYDSPNKQMVPIAMHQLLLLATVSCLVCNFTSQLIMLSLVNGKW